MLENPTDWKIVDQGPVVPAACVGRELLTL